MRSPPVTITKKILAIDQGTTSSRAIVFDAGLRQVAASQREFPQYFPEVGWVEHDAEEIWESVWETARDAMGKAGIGPKELAAIGITNQRETVLVWDRVSGKPLHRAIVWQDSRTASVIEHLRERGVEPALRDKTGLLLNPYFSATKLRWILEKCPDGLARAEAGDLAAGTIESWLIWKLSDGAAHVTDLTNASRTMLMDLRTEAWDPGLLDLFGIPAAVLPRIVSSAGELAMASAKLLGREVPIASAIGDQQAALFGQLCSQAGMAKCTYGTGCFLLLFTGSKLVPSQNRLLTTVAWQIEGQPVQYALEGSVFMGGASIQWLRDGLGLISSAREVNELAARVEESDGVVLVPAFTGLGAPYWDSSARGTLLGLSRGTTSAHIARATLEAIAHQVDDVLRAMEKDGDSKILGLRADGGASASNLLMQIQADILGVPVERPKDIESTALGAAMLAGLATGMFPDIKSLGDIRAVDKTFHPKIDRGARRQKKKLWRKAVKRSRGWVDESIQ